MEDTAKSHAGGPPGSFRVLAVGASAGGLKALMALLSALPADFAMPVLVVQHLSPSHRSRSAELIQKCCRLRVHQAEDGEALEPGRVFVAPPDEHLSVSSDGRVVLGRGARVHFTRPAVDVLFHSVAEVYGRRSVALVLTGGGEDGSVGALEIQDAGGTVIVQDPGTAMNSGMPSATLRRVPGACRLELDAVPPFLMGLGPLEPA